MTSPEKIQINPTDITQSDKFGNFIQNQTHVHRRGSYDLNITKFLGSINMAIIIDEMLYWYSPPKKAGIDDYATKLRVVRDGFLWIVRSREDWEESKGLSPKQYDYSMKKLVKLGYVVSEAKKYRGKKQCYIRLTPKFMLEYEEFLQAQEPKTPNYTVYSKDKDSISPNGEIGDTVFPQMGKYPPCKSSNGEILYTSPLSSTLLRHIPPGGSSPEKIQEDIRQEAEELMKSGLIERVEGWRQYQSTLRKSVDDLEQNSLLLREYHETQGKSAYAVSVILSYMNLQVSSKAYQEIVDVWDELKCMEALVNPGTEDEYTKYVCLLYTLKPAQRPRNADEFIRLLIACSLLIQLPIKWPRR